jgi:hypothetical protein
MQGKPTKKAQEILPLVSLPVTYSFFHLAFLVFNKLTGDAMNGTLASFNQSLTFIRL